MTEAEALATEPKAPALSRSVLFLLAFCAGASVANRNSRPRTFGVSATFRW